MTSGKCEQSTTIQSHKYKNKLLEKTEAIPEEGVDGSGTVWGEILGRPQGTNDSGMESKNGKDFPKKNLLEDDEEAVVVAASAF